MPYLSGSNVGLMRWHYTRLARRRWKPTIQGEGKDDNERAAEEQLVEELLALGARGGQAIYGVAEMLEAACQGHVRTLVVAEGLHLLGAECLRCGCLVRDGQHLCPACGAALAALDDVVERASERTLDERERVETVHGRAAMRLVEGEGGLGALLRFRVG
jgi:peptide subunit release factor 1 (eRF1)